MKTFFIHTFGCKTNQLESTLIEKQMIDFGMLLSSDFKSSDINIINSCTVTSKADDEVQYLARKIRRACPNTKIIVTGCFAQVGADVLANMPEVDLILGNSEKFKLAEHINSISDDKIKVSDIFEQKDFIDFDANDEQHRTRANLKVQDGCNNRCSYCIIPYARGKSRSNKLENILNQISMLIKNGFKEVVLTGIHLGQWGVDLGAGLSFIDLIKEIEKIEGLERYRLGSLDVNEITVDLIEIMATSNKCCNHLHVSLQSVDDAILKSMRRKYTVENCFDVINKLYKNVPDISIGCDIIVGFPGETDEMFDNTYENLKKLPLSYFHVFPYSVRNGTEAAKLPDHVEQKVKNLRADILKKLSRDKNIEFKRSFLGKDLDVLIEKKRDKATDMLKGLSKNYINILVDGEDCRKNTVCRVKVTRVVDSTLFGEFL